MEETGRFDESTRQWLAQLAGDGESLVFVRDRYRQTVYMSDNVVELTGWRSEDFIDRLYSLVHPDDQTLLFQASRELREGEAERLEFPVRVLMATGGFRWFHCHLESHFDDPRVDGLVSRLDPLGSVVPDLDRHVQLLATTNDVVLVFDRNLRAEYVSPSVEHVLGFTPEEIVERWRDILLGDDAAAFDKARHEVTATPGAEKLLRIRARRADGEVRTFDMVLANRFDDDAIDGLLVSARDVTDLVETEERLGRTEAYFEAMVEASPDVFMLLDAEGVIRYTTNGITALLGMEVDELLGRSPLEFVDADDLAMAADELSELMTGSGRTSHVVLPLRRADGRYVWAEISSQNHLDRPGLRSIVTTVRNVTDRIESEQRMERLLRDSSSAAFVADRELRITWRTPGVERFVGEGRQLRPDVVRARFDTEDDVDPIAAFHAVAADVPGTSRNIIGRLETAEGHRWVELTMSNAFDDPTIAGVIVSIRDVDDAVRASEAGQQLGRVLGSTTDMVFILNTDSTLIWANPAAAAVYGDPPVSREEILRRTPDWVRVVIDRDVRPTLAEKASWQGELAVLTTEGEELPLDVSMLVHRGRGEDTGFTSVFARDISDRKVLEARLHARARTDPLTGLPNRAMLTERLEQLFADGDPDIAVALIDLDQFKGINDTQGHDAGDQVLVAVTERLRHSAREADLVARFGGDEFVVVLADMSDADDARARVHHMLNELRGLVRVASIDVFLTASAGVALSNGVGVAELISNADTAMYAAKNAGRDQVAVYSENLRTRSVLRLETAHDLRSALDTDGLEVWYQPIVTTHDGRPVGMEGLVRWRHPEQGLLSPAEFIPIAEETGLIVPLGTAVIRQACAAVGGLGEGADVFTVSVNISAYQLADPELPEVLAACMEEHSVPPGRLTCEITESAVMRDVAMSAEVLDRIRSLGVGIAVDDFGTGYSSLAYLHRFPVDVLKIDREFIRGLSLDMDWKHSLAAGIVSLAHSLDLMVVAEGVETEEQAQILGMLGCDALQGFLFGRPTPLHEAPTVLRELRSAADLR